jgi:hypothetical protein
MTWKSGCDLKAGFRVKHRTLMNPIKKTQYHTRARADTHTHTFRESDSESLCLSVPTPLHEDNPGAFHQLPCTVHLDFWVHALIALCEREVSLVDCSSRDMVAESTLTPSQRTYTLMPSFAFATYSCGEFVNPARACHHVLFYYPFAVFFFIILSCSFLNRVISLLVCYFHSWVMSLFSLLQCFSPAILGAGAGGSAGGVRVL